MLERVIRGIRLIRGFPSARGSRSTTNQTNCTNEEPHQSCGSRLDVPASPSAIAGGRLQAALTQVANDWRELAHAIYKEDHYASHVAEEHKAQYRDEMLARADAIEAGEIESFTIAQRVDTALTGECVALLGA